jgi:hypothetical protein
MPPLGSNTQPLTTIEESQRYNGVSVWAEKEAAKNEKKMAQTIKRLYILAS